MGSNVREGGTFPVTCSNLGQLSPYNLKTLYGHFTQNFDRNIQIIETYETFSEYIWNLRNFLVLVGLLEREKNELWWKLLSCTHKYSTAVHLPGTGARINL